MDESNLQPAPDMVKLGDLHEAALLHNLRLRFQNDDIFTYIGPILVACNPYKAIPMFTPEWVEKYYTASAGSTLEPHVYELANNAYKQMMENNEDQSVVISGESGAGKTEETKLTLQFIAEVAKDPSLAGTGKPPEQLLLMSSPIMEAMGNAKTVRNNNSSRFGKYMQILFNSKGKIMGGETIKYLLEKSRIITAGVGERNYHIFYCINFLPPELKKSLHYVKADDFAYATKGGCTEVPGLNDESDFKDFREAWVMLGMDPKDEMSLFKIVAAILHLGNIEFEEDDEGNSGVSNDEVLENVGELLCADAELLETTLTFRNMQSGGRSIVVIPLKVQQAIETQEGLAKAAYSRTFDWVVERINQSVATDKPIKNSIGVLDIFGFEIFESNSFEQLCINLANEKLQSHFNEHIFKLELKIYEQEGLDIAGITFADNQPCLDMIEKKPKGIFPMCDEECVVPKGTDDTLLQKLQDTHRKNPFWGKAPKKTKTVFVVNHFAGGVPYNIENFLEKNRDTLQPDIQSYMAESSDPFIQHMFPAPKPSRGRAPTLGGQFRTSLQSLYDKLVSTAPHFIKCVKTNQVKTAGIFDGEYCLRQITYLGLLEVVNIRRQGFPIRRKPEVFFARYKVLDEAQKDSKALLTSCNKPGLWQVGKTMIFMKDEMYMWLETQRGLRLEKSVVLLQAFMRDGMAKACWAKLRQGFVGLHPVARGGMARMLTEKLKKLKKASDAITAGIDGVAARWPPAPDVTALEAAIADGETAPSTFGGSPLDGHDDFRALLAKAKELLATIQKEEKVYTGLEKALANEDEDEMNDALAEAAAINFKNDIVGKVEAYLNGQKEIRASAAAAASREDVIALLESALASDAGLKDQRKLLNGAVARAKESKVDDPLVAQCKELAQKIGETLTSEAALQDAIKKEIREDVEKALVDAEAHDVDAEIIAEGKNVIQMLDMKEELQALSKAQDAAESEEDKAAAEAKIDSLLSKAGESGIKLEKPVKGVSAAAMKSALGKKDMYESLKSVSVAARMAKMTEGEDGGPFALHKFELLRPDAEGGDMKQHLMYRTTDIERPMLIYTGDDSERIIELERKAIASFSSCLGYLGEKYHTNTEMLASQILQDGIENEELRDEIYLQTIMQSTNNPDIPLKEQETGYKRAWQLMSLLTKVFPPSDSFRPYVEVFLYNASHMTGGGGKTRNNVDKIITMAQTSLLKLNAMEAAQDTAPSEEEIKALRAEQPILLKIYFTDHSFKNFQIDESVTIQSLLDTISTTLKVLLIETYALYDVSVIKEPEVLDASYLVMNVMKDWQKKVKLSKKPFAKKGIAKHNMVFSKRLYVDKKGEVSSDPVELHLLYTQAKGCVMRGKYAVTDTEALLLAALTLQIECGNHNPEKHTAGFLRNELVKYIPKHLYGLQKPEVWEKDFVATHVKMKGFTEMMSKQAYVKACQKFRGYGYTFYPAKQTHLDKKEPKTIFLGVNVDGVAVFKTSDKSVYETYRFAKLKSWAASPANVTFKVSKDDKNHKLSGESVAFNTECGEDICKLLKDYALWLAAKRKREKAAKKAKEAGS
eukprot:COSAG01_NODE_840_length_13184_cov_18.465724_5_plen_1561_part_00